MTEHAEFRPIETVQARRVWPYALLGAVLVSGLIYVIAHRVAAAPPAPQSSAALAPKIDAQQAAQTLAQPPVQAAVAKPIEGPNVLGGEIDKLKSAAVGAVEKTKAVARGEIEREQVKTRGAQKQIESYKKQNAELQKQLEDARAQIAALQAAKKGPPPSDQEQILQMLAPVLKTSSNDGRP